MIVSHKGRFVIAAIAGLGLGPWIKRIAAEGPEGWLEVVGHPNGVGVPDGCESYDRFFIDAPQHRLPRMFNTKAGTPWEGPRQVRDDLEGWLKWYIWSMRRRINQEALESGPNGWGLRGEDGDWLYFDSPANLARTFAGIGTSPKGEDAPWGRLRPTFLKLEESSSGWRQVIRKLPGTGEDAKAARELLRWHIPEMHQFYELPDELVNAYLHDGAWEFRLQLGIEWE